MKGRILRLWTYFRRGHTTYLAFLMSFANFIVIQYRLLIENIPMFASVFDSIAVFAAAFFAAYVPFATVIGWLDYKRYAMPVEMELAARANPFSRDLARAIVMLANGDNEAAARIMSRWVGRDAEAGSGQD